jgi:hypothetical protein
MALPPIAFTAPSYTDHKLWWLKAYEPNTTTAKTMYSDSVKTVSFAKIQINQDGFFEVAGEAIVTPHIDGAYDLFLFPSESDADNNDTTNAIKIAKNNLRVKAGEYIKLFDTVADAQAATDLKVGDTIMIKERANALFEVVTGVTANGYDVITGNDVSFVLEDKQEISLTELGVKDGDDATTAINIIISRGAVVIIPIGRFLYTKQDIREAGVTIRGVKMPSINQTETTLENGSILVGTLQIKGKDPSLENMGVDHGFTAFGATGGNAIELPYFDPFGADKSTATLNNVVGLGANVEDPYHAILVEGHYDTNISNVIGARTFYGIALKNTRNNLFNGIFLHNGSDNIIVKSDSTSGIAKQVNINNVICIGSGTTGGETTSNSIRLRAFEDDITDVNIHNVYTENAAYSINLDSTGTVGGNIDRVNISNLNGKDMGRVILIDGGTTGKKVDNVNISNVNVTNVDFRVFESKNTVGRVSVSNWRTINKAGSGYTASTFQVGAGQAALTASNVELLVDDGSVGTLLLANSSTYNKINGENDVILHGSGIPNRSYQLDTSTGSNITVAPVYNSKNISVIEMGASGTRSISAINDTLQQGQYFPAGYEVVIINNASGVLSILNNPAGNIQNRGGVQLDLQPLEAASYIYLNNYWHQIT